MEAYSDGTIIFKCRQFVNNFAFHQNGRARSNRCNLPVRFRCDGARRSSVGIAADLGSFVSLSTTAGLLNHPQQDKRLGDYLPPEYENEVEEDTVAPAGFPLRVEPMSSTLTTWPVEEEKDDMYTVRIVNLLQRNKFTMRYSPVAAIHGLLRR